MSQRCRLRRGDISAALDPQRLIDAVADLSPALAAARPTGLLQAGTLQAGTLQAGTLQAGTLQPRSLQTAVLQTRSLRRQPGSVAVSPSVQSAEAPAAQSEPRGWPIAVRTTATVWFDHTDLAHYFSNNRTPTGIQRVEIELYRAGRRRIHAADGPRAGACAFDPDRRCWVILPRAAFDLLCSVPSDAHAGDPDDRAGAGLLDEAAWAEAVAALQAEIGLAPPVPFRRHDVLVTVGASWWIPDYLVFVRHLQQERGVLYAPFVHDCIPVLVPETCAAGLVAEFRDWFAAAMHAADLTFANSRCTAQDVVSCAVAAGLPVPSPHVIRLDAHAGVRASPDTRQEAQLVHARLGIRRRFALFVATIEARKDHIFVFRCWQELIARYGAEAVPDLLCVGKPGWLVEFTLNWLQVNPHLAGRVRLLGTVSDDELAVLYATAEFCVYNSHYEGWGLPVTESLCHGRVPLVPHHSSLPEAGGSFATYFEPGSPESFIAQATRLLDAGLRAGLERRIRARFRPRRWSAVLEQIMATAARAPTRVRPPAVGVPLQGGGIYSFGRRSATNPPGRARNGRTLLPGSLARYGTGWWLPEEWGCWSKSPQAQLLFSLASGRAEPIADEATTLEGSHTTSAEPRRYLVYVLLRGGPAPQRVQMEAGGVRTGPIMLQPHRRELLRLSYNDVVATGGDVLIGLSAEPYSLADHTDGRDPRCIGFGLEALAVIEATDLQSRADILEMAVMPT